jgi:hypothetical protein
VGFTGTSRGSSVSVSLRKVPGGALITRDGGDDGGIDRSWKSDWANARLEAATISDAAIASLDNIYLSPPRVHLMGTLYRLAYSSIYQFQTRV